MPMHRDPRFKAPAPITSEIALEPPPTNEDRPQPRRGQGSRFASNPELVLRLLDPLSEQIKELSVDGAKRIGEHLDRIIGPDDRVFPEPGHQPDPKDKDQMKYLGQFAWPWLPGYFRRNCLLIADLDGTETHGTGFCIHPRVVLTAGHCLYSRDTGKRASRVRVQPGASTLYKEAALPEVTAGAEALCVPAGYTDLSLDDWENDFAAILLDKPQPVECYQLRAATDQELLSSDVLVVGYPQDRHDGQEQFVGRGTILDAQPRRLLHNVDTEEGQSGSGIFLLKANRPEVIGIHCAPYSSKTNSGLRLTPDILSQIREWVGRVSGA